MLTISSPPISEPQPWALPGAPPRFATPRNPAAYTEGPQVGVVAKTLGTPLIPWQQYTADVAGERRDDGSYEYEVVVVTVPRQTGKTTLIRAVGTQRALSGRDVFYTAQTGKDARARWYDLVKILRVNAALRDRIKVALRGGSEHVLFPSGAVFQCFAPTPESLHGYTPPTVMVDEAFSQTGGKGELLMGAIGPAQFTIIDRQIWIVSTAGTAESEWLHGWIEKAMEGVARVALFDWGARDDQNPYALEDIAAFHPGVGFELNGKTLVADDVLAELEKNTRAEYERAFANRRTLTANNLIPAESWRPLKLTHAPAALDYAKCVLSYDVAVDRQSAAIVATWAEPNGDPCSLVLRHAPGTSWLAGAVDELARTGRPRALAAVDNGPVLDITRQLRALGHDPDVLGEREFSAATTAVLTRVDDQSTHWWADTDQAAALFERSVTGLVTRSSTVDGVAFSRRHSVGDSSVGIAYTAGLAVLAKHQHHAAPMIRFGKSA